MTRKAMEKSLVKRCGTPEDQKETGVLWVAQVTGCYQLPR